MEFVTNRIWQVMFMLAFLAWLLLLFRELYRYRLLVSKVGAATTFLAIILVFGWISVIVTMLIKTGFLSAVLTFVFFLVTSSLILAGLEKSRSSFLHPESVARAKYERMICESMIQQVTSREDVQQLIAKYERTPDFLRDLMERFYATGNHKALTKISSMSNLHSVLEIYSSNDWTDESKFIEASNFLEYGSREIGL